MIQLLLQKIIKLNEIKLRNLYQKTPPKQHLHECQLYVQIIEWNI